MPVYGSTGGLSELILFPISWPRDITKNPKNKMLRDTTKKKYKNAPKNINISWPRDMAQKKIAISFRQDITQKKCYLVPTRHNLFVCFCLFVCLGFTSHRHFIGHMATFQLYWWRKTSGALPCNISGTKL